MTTLTHPNVPETTSTDRRASPQFPLGWLRGLAALTVLTFHAYQHNRTGAEYAWPWSGAAHQAMLGTDLFVDMFFVLSGFVLWLTVARATIDGRTGRPGWVLLFRRMARLLPLYYTIVHRRLGGHEPVAAGALAGPAAAPELHSRLQRPVHLLGRRPRVVTRSRVPLLRADGAVGAAGARRSSTYDDPAGQARRRTRTSHAPDGHRRHLPALGHRRRVTPARPNWSVWFSPMSRAADFGIGAALAVISAAGVRLGRGARVTAGLVGIASLAVLVMNRPDVGVRRLVGTRLRAGDRGRPVRDRAARRSVACCVQLAPTRVDRWARLRHLPDSRAGHADPGPRRRAALRAPGPVLPDHRGSRRRRRSRPGLGQLEDRRGGRAQAPRDHPEGRTPRDYYAHLDPAERKPEPART